jgi:hypothetical protein
MTRKDVVRKKDKRDIWDKNKKNGRTKKKKVTLNGIIIVFGAKN